MFGDQEFEDAFKKAQQEIEAGRQRVETGGTVVKWAVGAFAVVFALCVVLVCCRHVRRRRGRILAMRVVTTYPVAQATAAPYPTAGAQYPTAAAPYHDAAAPYPAAGAPYPTAGSPYPAAGAPYPSAGAPYPTTAAPYPTTGAPYPTAGAPYPAAAGAPYYDAGASLPAAGAPYSAAMLNPSAPVATETLPPSYEQATGDKLPVHAHAPF